MIGAKQRQLLFNPACPSCNSQQIEIERPGLRWRCNHCRGLAREDAGRLVPLFGWGLPKKSKRVGIGKLAHDTARQFFE